MRLFDTVTEAVFSAMLLLIMLAIVIGVARLFLNLLIVWQGKGITGQYQTIISDVLTLFIVIDLSRSLVEYFKAHRLRLTFILDAGIVFILREVMIYLFEKDIIPTEIYAYSALLFTLGILRIGSVVLFQREKMMLDTLSRELGESRRRPGRNPLESASEF